MSRPEKEIDWVLVDKLLIAGCTGTEICSHFDMHHDTFYRRVEQKYGTSFTYYQQEKRQRGDSLLRAKQYEKAIQGDNTMLVWLGKNRMKQKETPDENNIAENIKQQYEMLMSQIKSLQGDRKIEEISNKAEDKS
jgi:hypothetical protein